MPNSLPYSSSFTAYAVIQSKNSENTKQFAWGKSSMPFKSLEELNSTLATNEMQEVAADAHRISSGGEPSIMIGEE